MTWLVDVVLVVGSVWACRTTFRNWHHNPDRDRRMIAHLNRNYPESRNPT